MTGELERTFARRAWAAAVLAAGRVDTFLSVVASEPVLACDLDGDALRLALRGGCLPSPDAFVEVTSQMLDAVAESGPFTEGNAL